MTTLSSTPSWTPDRLAWLQQRAIACGFTLAGVAPVDGLTPAELADAERFEAWIAAGHAGEMDYLKRRDPAGRLLRSAVRVAIPWARSVVLCALNYRTPGPLSIDPAPTGAAWIGRYAATGRAAPDTAALQPTDYHDVLLTRLRRLEAELQAELPCESRCYVDTGPMVERAVAARAGIGWIAKNTTVLNQQIGSWTLLASLITSIPVPEPVSPISPQSPLVVIPQGPASSTPAAGAALALAPDSGARAPAGAALALAPNSRDHCGTCTRCLDACPTDALIAPRQMDARRCIAYLTIEKKGPIDPDLRAGMGRQVFGCDICQDVCPWNHRALLHGVLTTDPEILPRPDLLNPDLETLAALTPAAFRALFRGSPLERTGRKRLLRNVAIAMGNSGESRFRPRLHRWAADADTDPVLAEAATWALHRLDALC